MDYYSGTAGKSMEGVMVMDGRDGVERLSRINHPRGLAHNDLSKC